MSWNRLDPARLCRSLVCALLLLASPVAARDGGTASDNDRAKQNGSPPEFGGASGGDQRPEQIFKPRRNPHPRETRPARIKPEPAAASRER